MNTTIEKFEDSIFYFNKCSFIGLSLTSSLCCFLLGVDTLRTRVNLLTLFFLGYSFIFLYIAKYAWELNKKSKIGIDNIHNIIFGLSCFFFPAYLTLGYLNGLQLIKTQKIFYFSIGILHIIFTT